MPATSRPLSTPSPTVFLIDTTDAPARRPQVLVEILRSRRKETKLVVIVPNTVHDAEKRGVKNRRELSAQLRVKSQVFREPISL